MSGEVLPFFAMDTKDCKFLLNNGYEIEDLHKLNKTSSYTPIPDSATSGGKSHVCPSAT